MVVAGSIEFYLCMGNVGGCISSSGADNVSVPSALIILLILSVVVPFLGVQFLTCLLLEPVDI